MPNNRDGDGSDQTFAYQQLEVKGLEPGTVLNDRYEIVRRLDTGKLSAVYLANDRNFGDSPRMVEEFVGPALNPVQLKKALADFNSEMLLLSSRGNPSIPVIDDYFYVEPGRFYLVSEYVSGDDLYSLMQSADSGRIDEKTVTEWAIQIADALEYLHTLRQPIIYQNLKPKKVMIDDKKNRLILRSSGIAHWLKQNEKGLIATVGYCPPELFDGRLEPSSDIYSLGATMFQLLTGVDPQDDPLLVFDFTKNPKPRQITPSISTEMERILMRSVEYKPEDRFPSAGEMRDTLSTHLESLTAPTSILANETIQVQSVYCGSCGNSLADEVFCPYCGERQPTVGRDARVTPDKPEERASNEE